LELSYFCSDNLTLTTFQINIDSFKKAIKILNNNTISWIAAQHNYSLGRTKQKYKSILIR